MSRSRRSVAEVYTMEDPRLIMRAGSNQGKSPMVMSPLCTTTTVYSVNKPNQQTKRKRFLKDDDIELQSFLGGAKFVYSFEYSRLHTAKKDEYLNIILRRRLAIVKSVFFMEGVRLPPLCR